VIVCPSNDTFGHVLKLLAEIFSKESRLMWYYQINGTFEDVVEGPYTNNQFMKLLFEGTVNPDTAVLHEEHTAGQWVRCRAFPNCVTQYERGAEHREAIKEEARQQRLIERKEIADTTKYGGLY